LVEKYAICAVTIVYYRCSLCVGSYTPSYPQIMWIKIVIKLE